MHNTYKREREKIKKKNPASTEGSAIENGRRTKIDHMKIIRGSEKEERNLKWKKRKHHLPLPGADSFIVITHNPTYPFDIFKNLHQFQYFKNYVAWKGDTNSREGPYLRGAQEIKAEAEGRKGKT